MEVNDRLPSSIRQQDRVFFADQDLTISDDPQRIDQTIYLAPKLHLLLAVQLLLKYM